MQKFSIFAGKTAFPASQSGVLDLNRLLETQGLQRATSEEANAVGLSSDPHRLNVVDRHLVMCNAVRYEPKTPLPANPSGGRSKFDLQRQSIGITIRAAMSFLGQSKPPQHSAPGTYSRRINKEPRSANEKKL